MLPAAALRPDPRAGQGHQRPPRPARRPVRHGRPAAAACYKAGQWAPVYVDLECVRDTRRAAAARRRDDGRRRRDHRRLRSKSPPMAKGDRPTGNELGRLAVPEAGHDVRRRSPSASRAPRAAGPTASPARPDVRRASTARRTSSLGVGYNLNGFRLPCRRPAAAATTRTTAAANSAAAGWRRPRSSTSAQLPDQWFGYNAVDVLILGTGADRAFWDDARRPAAREAAQGAGRVGPPRRPADRQRRHATRTCSTSLKEIKDMLPATVPPGGKRTVERRRVRLAGGRASTADAAADRLPRRQERVRRRHARAAARTGRPHDPVEEPDDQRRRSSSRGRTAWAG